MKSNLIKYSLLIISILYLTSCQEFLEEEAVSIIISGQISTEEEAELYAVGVYNSLQRDGTYARTHFSRVVTDIVRAQHFASEGGLSDFTYTQYNQHIETVWKDHYKGVNEANTAIANIPLVQNMDKQRNKHLLSEALFIRSLYFFNLVRWYGDIPLPLTPTESLITKLPRTPREKVFEQIISDLEFCDNNLTPKDGLNGYIGRVTLEAAQTLLSKVYLTLGSLEKRDGISDGKKYFALARNYATKVIESGNYELVNYYPDVFKRENKNNKEIIFDVQFQIADQEGSAMGLDIGISGDPTKGGAFGGAYFWTGTQYYHLIFEKSDSIRARWTTDGIELNPSDGYSTLLYSPPALESCVYRIGKWRRWPVRINPYEAMQGDVNYPIFRYAEVLLIYAEAINEVNQGPSQEAIDACNLLRKRARWSNIGWIHYDILPRELSYNASSVPDITLAEFDYDSFVEYILNERARELGAEGKRFFDLQRWGNLVERIRFVGNYVQPDRGKVEHKWEDIMHNINEKHILMPIPFAEIQANPNMTQNSGYY